MDIEKRMDQLEQMVIKIVKTQSMQEKILDRLTEDYLNRCINIQDDKLGVMHQ